MIKASKSFIQHVTDRLYLRRVYPTIIFILLLTSLVLSVLFVFSIPPPIRPKTSIGIIMLNAVLAMSLSFLVHGSRQQWIRFQSWGPLDFAVVWYTTACLLSLLFTKTIQDTTPLKLLLSGVALYFVAQNIPSSPRRMTWIIHILGVVSVGIATLGLLQVAIPNLMNSIADLYLHGRESYGISIEFNRGRLLHWGVLVFIFPFFYASAILIPWRKRFWTTLYVVYGYVAILGALIVANFRWAFIVYTLGTILFMWIMHIWKQLSWERIRAISLTTAFIGVIGITIARAAFGYNLIDRFLFRDSHRDFTESLGRITLFDQALTVFEAFPLVGAGFGNYYSVVWPFPHQRYFSIFDQIEVFPVPIASHNEILTVLAETGIMGLLGYLLMIYLIGKQLLCRIVHERSLVGRLFYFTIGVSYISIFIYVIFENMYPQNIVYILIMGSIAAHWGELSLRRNSV